MSEAERLAAELMSVHRAHSDEGPTTFSESAAELTRLDSINAELLEALQDMGMRYGLTEIARAAIAKATQGEMK